MDWITACKEFGVLGGLLLLILAGFMTMCALGFKWILEQFKVELMANRTERTQYLVTLNKMNERMEEHAVRSKDFQVNVACEHREMIKNLGEITVTLGRINGYKHG